MIRSTKTQRFVSRPAARASIRVTTVENGRLCHRSDELAAEEPLEIRVCGSSWRRTLALTMRTPGADFELVAGFLYGEGLIKTRPDLREMTYCLGTDRQEQQYNVVNARLSEDAAPDFDALQRHFYVTSACGVCGKASLDALRMQDKGTLSQGPLVQAADLFQLPSRVRAAQAIFRCTGGLHAAALADKNGSLIAVREDVGRHNALDKLIGWALLNDELPLTDRLIFVSGRTSFEIMQKSLAAGAAMVCAISAPSSLAVRVAQEFGMTLIGFLRDSRFNIYAGEQRIALDQERAIGKESVRRSQDDDFV